MAEIRVKHVVVYPSQYAALQNDYFGAEVHVLPGCGHWPMIDEPQVRALVIPFLRKHTGTGLAPARGVRGTS